MLFSGVVLPWGGVCPGGNCHDLGSVRDVAHHGLDQRLLLHKEGETSGSTAEDGQTSSPTAEDGQIGSAPITPNDRPGGVFHSKMSGRAPAFKFGSGPG